MSEFHTLITTLDAVWQRLEAGVEDHAAPARHIVLATVSSGGNPSARLVVLRGADRPAGVLRAYTDAASAKIADLTANPQASVLVWDASARIQIRITCTVAVLEGPEVADVWAALPDVARANYGTLPVPGTPIDAPEDVAVRVAEDRFRVLECRIDAIETLHLGPDRHRRAIFTRADAFRGQWLAP